MIQIHQKDLKRFREKFHKKQNMICPIFKQEIPFENTVVDHKHRRKKDIIGKNGKGLIRGIIHAQANVLEGKISNAYVRYGLHKYIDLPSFLRNLADYLEHPPLGYKFIHPNEKAEILKLTKRSYLKLVQKLNKIGYTKKIPEFRVHKNKPSRHVQTLTKPLEKLYAYANLKPEFYSQEY